MVTWPDVYSKFSFEITHSTRCESCNHINQSETLQTYVELQVPPDGSTLKDYVEDHFNSSTMVGVFCEDGCKKFVQAAKSSRIKDTSDAEFIPVILTRAVETLDGYKLNRNKIISSNDIFIR